jgi:hypothetical protein
VSNGYNNFQSVTFPLKEIPMDVLSDMLNSNSLNIKVEWYKIYNHNGTPFTIALKNIHQTNTFSSTTQNSSAIILYSEDAYKTYDSKNIAGITTVDYHFLRNRSLTVQFLNPETEVELTNTSFTNTNVRYIISLLISY